MLDCGSISDNQTKEIPFTGWWQLKYVLFSPRSLGKWSNLTCAYFSDMWFNHQLVMLRNMNSLTIRKFETIWTAVGTQVGLKVLSTFRGKRSPLQLADVFCIMDCDQCGFDEETCLFDWLLVCLFDCLFVCLMDWFELLFFDLHNDCFNLFCIDESCLKVMASILIGDMFCRWMYMTVKKFEARNRPIAEVCWTALLWLSYLKSYYWYNSSTTLVKDPCYFAASSRLLVF